VLFHVTIAHKAHDCPGRRTEPPALVAPSDARERLGSELNVKLHFVLWGAACMLWAQPDHVAFVVVEAEDVESALQFVTALVPQDWTSNILPVWNLPSQLRLIRQVRMVTPSGLGEGLPPVEAAPRAPVEAAPKASVEAAAKPPPTKLEAPARRRAVVPEEKPEEPPLEDHNHDRAEVTAEPVSTSTPPEPESPGTITRLLRELDTETTGPTATPASAAAPAAKAEAEAEAPRPLSTQIIEPRQRDPKATASAKLVASAGPAKGRTFSVASGGATVGRLPEHEVYIPDERLSREHARIEYRDGRYWLEDLGSLNGTALNGTLVAGQQPLQSGDTIELGSTKLVVTIDPI
jgi:hypothetical protein